MDFALDIEGFNLIDEEYQKERLELRKKTEEKVNEEFSRDQFVGDAARQRTDRAAEEVRKQRVIETKFNEQDQILQQNHFGKGGRDEALKVAQEQGQQQNRPSEPEAQDKQLNAQEQQRQADELQRRQTEKIREQEQLAERQRRQEQEDAEKKKEKEEQSREEARNKQQQEEATRDKREKMEAQTEEEAKQQEIEQRKKRQLEELDKHIDQKFNRAADDWNR